MLPLLLTLLMLNWALLFRRTQPRTFAVYAFGDSITVGYEASNHATTAYVPLLAANKGWSITNLGEGSATVVEQADPIYATVITTDTISTYMLGTNDERYRTTEAAQSDWVKTNLAQLAYLAIPNDRKVLGSDTGRVTYVGDWSASGYYSIGRTTSTDGDTATFTVTGHALILAFTADGLTAGQTGAFSITVDGELIDTYSSSFTWDDPATYHAPFAVIVSGLDSGAHTVVIEKTSAGGDVWFDWAAGLRAGYNADQPYVYAANVIRANSTGYAGTGGSDERVIAMGAMIAENVARLRSYGLNVFLVDVFHAVNTTSHLDADGLHPNDAGHTAIANAFIATANPVMQPISYLHAPGGYLRTN